MELDESRPSLASSLSAITTEQRLRHASQGQPRAIFTRRDVVGKLVGEVERCFEMPFIDGISLCFGRYDERERTDRAGATFSRALGKVVLAMEDRPGLSRNHGWIECHESKGYVLVPLQKAGFPTSINGLALPVNARPVVLCDGDEIGFGCKPSVVFRIELVNMPKQPTPSPRRNDDPCAPTAAGVAVGDESGRAAAAAPDALIVTPAKPTPANGGSAEDPASTATGTLAAVGSAVGGAVVWLGRMLSFGASSFLTLPTVGRTSSTPQAMSSPGPAAGVDAEIVKTAKGDDAARHARLHEAPDPTDTSAWSAVDDENEGVRCLTAEPAHHVISPKEQLHQPPTTMASLSGRFEVYAKMAALGGGAGRHCLAGKSKA